MCRRRRNQLGNCFVCLFTISSCFARAAALAAEHDGKNKVFTHLLRKSSTSRQTWLRQIGMLSSVLSPTARAIDDAILVSQLQLDEPDVSHNDHFDTTARSKVEYSNSITASRDTNISPREAYEVILQHIPPNKDDIARACDMGAGAGLSTSVLYKELGYHQIDAVDWSGDAWRYHVTAQPRAVTFYEQADDEFWKQKIDVRYHAIVYNFAINPKKARQVAKQHLVRSGLLLAPVNDATDYWYKQSYWLLNSKGDLTYRSNADVGAWSVQFQPDVTSASCTGIWCGSYNGFLHN